MREPVTVIYTNVKNKLGNPKEYRSDLPPPTEGAEPQIQFKIPNNVIKGNMNITDHELAFASGGIMPISTLVPFMGRKWRIKARLVKKSER